MINPRIQNALNAAASSAARYSNAQMESGNREARQLLDAFQQLHKAIVLLAEDVARIDSQGKQQSSPPTER